MNKAVKHGMLLSLLISTNITFATETPAVPPPAEGAAPATNQQDVTIRKVPINPQGTAPTQYRDAAQAAREYALKGAFLRYVAKYVIFPTDSLQGSNINLCVLGQVPAFQGINSINGKVVNDRSIAVSKILDINEAKTQHCQIVYVAKTETNNIKDLINTMSDEPILGFGDMDTFAQAGGEMNFYIANNHLAIMTNMPAVEKAKLSIDPQMLKLITFVPKVEGG